MTFKVSDQFSRFACFAFAWQTIIVYTQVETERAQFTCIKISGEYFAQSDTIHCSPPRSRRVV